MKLTTNRILTALAALFFVTNSALAYHPTEVSRAAEHYAVAAEHFHRVIHHLTGYSHLAQDVHRLSQDARHFRRVVEGGASYEHVRRDFQRIRASFSHVRRAFSQAHGAHHNWHIRRDFNRLQHAFEDLQYAMYEGEDH